MSEPRHLQEGDVLWTPSADSRDRSRLGAYVRWLEGATGRRFDDYASLWRWSVADPGAFWESIWLHFGVRAHTPYSSALESPRWPATSCPAGAANRFTTAHAA